MSTRTDSDVPSPREPRRSSGTLASVPRSNVVPPRADAPRPSAGAAGETLPRYDRRGGFRGDPFALTPVAEPPRSSRGSRERGAVIDGRYVVERELGHGGMATVLLARDIERGRDVAVKLVHADADRVGVERFQREIAVLARLHHAHILPLLDSGATDGDIFYVMPFVDGESLRDRLRRERRLPVGEAVRIAREVADALAHAHAHGVIHRDIKPENILLANGHALVCDFGIARAAYRAGARRLTDDGFAIGTPAYMSPEQASGDPADERSDLYSLACVLFEMLAGTPPFDGGTSGSFLARRLTEHAPALRRLRGEIPAPVDAVLTVALAREPSSRQRSLAEFSRALALAMDGPARRRAVWQSIVQRRRRA